MLCMQEHQPGRDQRSQDYVSERPGSGNRARVQASKGQGKASRQQSLDKKRAGTHGRGQNSVHAAEDTAETNGKPQKDYCLAHAPLAHIKKRVKPCGRSLDRRLLKP